MSNVAVLGSLTFKHPYLVQNYIADLPAGSVIISNDDNGIGYYAKQAALKNKLVFIQHEPKSVIKECDELLVFWNGIDASSKAYIECGIVLKIPTTIVLEDASKQMINKK